MKFSEIKKYLLHQEYSYELTISNDVSLLFPFIKISLNLITKIFMMLFNILILLVVILPWTACWVNSYISEWFKERKELSEEEIEADEVIFETVENKVDRTRNI